MAATTGSLIPARRVRSFPQLGRSQAFTRCPAMKMPRRFHAIRSTGRVYASTQVKRTRVRYFGSHPIVKALPLQVLSIKLLMHAQQDQGTILLAFRSCMGSCTIDFCKWRYFQRVMRADLRISIKYYHVLVDGVRSCWLIVGRPVSLTRLVPAWRKSLVRAGRAGDG